MSEYVTEDKIHQAEDETDRLIQGYRKKKPTLGMKIKSNIKANWKSYAEQKKRERQVYIEAYKKARIKRAKVEGKAAAFGRPSPYIPKQKTYHISDIWTSHPQPRKKRPQKKTSGYVIINGMAYKKGSTSSRHKKQSSRKRRQYNNPWDINFRW